MTKTDIIEVGQVRAIPFHMSKDTLVFNCVILDTRLVYGRHEVKIAPVDGEGAAWVTEDTVKGKTAATVTTKHRQGRHDA